jgi:hypothetical protein
MKAQIETVNGKPVLTVFYDSSAHDWDEAIAAGLASCGLERGKVKVVAVPLPSTTTTGQAGLFEP